MWSVAVFMLYFIISATLCTHCELPDSVVLAADGKVVFSSSFCRMTTCVPGMKIKVLMTVSFTTSCSFLCVLLRASCWILIAYKWLIEVLGPSFAFIDALILGSIDSPRCWKPSSETKVAPCFNVVYTKFRAYHQNVAAHVKTHQTRQCFCPILIRLRES